MTDGILLGVCMFALSVFIRWITRPDPQVVKQTKERKEMQIREESSSRWDA